MRFFLVARDRGSGDVRIVSGLTFATRQDALDSLSDAADADPSLTEAELFVVDLEAVTPVVLYRTTSAAGAAASEPASGADAWEAPAEEPVDAALFAGLLEPVDEGMPVAAQAGDEGLADALRRAAGRMESEGVQPAATVEEVLAAQAPEPADTEQSTDGEPELLAEAAPDEPATTETGPEEAAEGHLPEEADDGLADELDALASVAAGAALLDDDAPAEPSAAEEASEGLLSVIDLPAPEPAVEEPSDDQSSWPWEPTGADAPPAVVEPASELYRPTGIDEPAVAVSDMLATPPDDFTPRPVIMGDYADDGPAGAPLETTSEASAPVQHAQEPGSEPVGLEELGLPSEWLEDAEPSVEITGAATAAADGAGEGLLEPDAPVYQPATIDLDAYSCEDCVYSGTCPKAGQDTPATCGSFQWKSV